MPKYNQNFPCQLCQTEVPFEKRLFLRGASFSCPNPKCDAVYSLSPESRSLVASALDEFENLKALAAKNS